MSHPRRTFVENATPAGILWAIIMPPSNSGRSQIPRSLYNSPRPLSRPRPLSSSLSLPLSTLSHGSHIRLVASSIRLFARHPHSLSWYHLGSASHSGHRSSTPLDHLLATDGRNCPLQSTAHTRSYAVRHFMLSSTVNLNSRHKFIKEQSVRPLPVGDHPNSIIHTRTHPGPYERRPPPSDGFRNVIPPSPLGCSSAAEPTASHAPSRVPFQLIRHPTSPSQPSQETPRLHPVGSMPLAPRPPSPSSTISENESPRSETSSQGDLSADDSVPPATADKQSDSGRRHACPHCAKRFNRPSSLAIHVNTHTGDKRKLIQEVSIQPADLPSPLIPKHSNVRTQIVEESLMSTRICAATIGNISVQRFRRHPDPGRSIRLRDLLALAYRSYDITTINQKTWVGSHPLIPPILGSPAQRTHGGNLCKSCMAPSCMRPVSRTVKVKWTVCASFVSSVLDSHM